MTKTPTTDLTQLANQARNDPKIAQQFVDAVYMILREMAATQLARESHPTLETTELVQEVVIDLLKSGKVKVFKNREEVRGGLFRRIKNKLIDRGRRRQRLKRFSGTANVSLDSPAAMDVANSTRGPFEIAASREDLLALQNAMAKLEIQHRNAHQVVQMHIKQYSIQKIADELDVSPKTIKRWSFFANAFLSGELTSREKIQPPGAHHDPSQQRSGPAA